MAVSVPERRVPGMVASAVSAVLEVLGRGLRAWHLLSLDAPTVAMLWAWYLVRAQGEESSGWSIPLLGVATWLLYVADRLLDGYRGQGLCERHVFHRRYRRRLIPLAGVMAGALTWAAWVLLPREELRVALGLAAVVALYLAAVHVSRAAGRWLPKTMAVAVIFAVAVSVPAWTLADHLTGAGRAALGFKVALFAGVCWLNCVAIKRWEGQSAVHASTRWAGSHLWALAFTAVCIAVLAMPSRVAMAVLLSALILAGLDAVRGRLSALQLRIAADVALLSPLLWLHR